MYPDSRILIWKIVRSRPSAGFNRRRPKNRPRKRIRVLSTAVKKQHGTRSSLLQPTATEKFSPEQNHGHEVWRFRPWIQHFTIDNLCTDSHTPASCTAAKPVVSGPQRRLKARLNRPILQQWAFPHLIHNKSALFTHPVLDSTGQDREGFANAGNQCHTTRYPPHKR